MKEFYLGSHAGLVIVWTDCLHINKRNRVLTLMKFVKVLLNVMSLFVIEYIPYLDSWDTAFENVF